MNDILAIDMNFGPVAWLVTADNVNAEVFRSFIVDTLLPRLGLRCQDDIHFRRTLLWDNLRAHFLPTTLSAIIDKGHEFVARPAYSPDMAPIESAFSKIKGILCKDGHAMTKHNIVNRIEEAIKQITPLDVQGWFWNCHYKVPGRQHKEYSGVE